MSGKSWFDSLRRMLGGTDGGDGKDGARAILTPLLDPYADHRAISLELKPARAEHRAFWRDDGVAAQSWDYYERLWDDPDTVIAPKYGQTILGMWAATTADIQARNAAGRELPGGYEAIAELLSPGLTIYGFNFTAPGERFGMTYDGLVHLNGRWVIFAKPWRAFS